MNIKCHSCSTEVKQEKAHYHTVEFCSNEHLVEYIHELDCHEHAMQALMLGEDIAQKQNYCLYEALKAIACGKLGEPVKVANEALKRLEWYGDGDEFDK